MFSQAVVVVLVVIFWSYQRGHCLDYSTTGIVIVGGAAVDAGLSPTQRVARLQPLFPALSKLFFAVPAGCQVS